MKLTAATLVATLALLGLSVANNVQPETPEYAYTARSQAQADFQLSHHGPYGLPRHARVNLPTTP